MGEKFCFEAESVCGCFGVFVQLDRNKTFTDQ